MSIRSARIFRRRRGVMMFEMLMLIIILGAFAVVATRMFVTLMKLNQQTAQGHTDTVRLDAAIRALRADVWSAGKVVTSETEVTLQDGRVQWKVQEDGTLIRIEQREGKRDEKHWAVGIPQLRFGYEESSVIVTVPDTKSIRGGMLRLPSAVFLAERMAS